MGRADVKARPSTKRDAFAVSYGLQWHLRRATKNLAQICLKPALVMDIFPVP